MGTTMTCSLSNPQPLGLDVIELIVDDGRAGQQEDGHGELYHHQHLTHPQALLSRLGAAFHYFGRQKTGEIRSRITAGGQSDQGRTEDQRGQHHPVGNRRRELFSRDFVHGRQGEMDQYDRQDRGETRHEDRFAQELSDQLHPVRTQHLSHAHLPGAHFGTGPWPG